MTKSGLSLAETNNITGSMTLEIKAPEQDGVARIIYESPEGNTLLVSATSIVKEAGKWTLSLTYRIRPGKYTVVVENDIDAALRSVEAQASANPENGKVQLTGLATEVSAADSAQDSQWRLIELRSSELPSFGDTKVLGGVLVKKSGNQVASYEAHWLVRSDLDLSIGDWHVATLSGSTYSLLAVTPTISKDSNDTALFHVKAQGIPVGAIAVLSWEAVKDLVKTAVSSGEGQVAAEGMVISWPDSTYAEGVIGIKVIATSPTSTANKVAASDTTTTENVIKSWQVKQSLKEYSGLFLAGGQQPMIALTAESSEFKDLSLVRIKFIGDDGTTSFIKTTDVELSGTTLKLRAELQKNSGIYSLMIVKPVELVAEAKSTLLAVAPTKPTIAINEGAKVTNQNTVSLSLSAVGASEMLLSGTTSCDGGTWEAYSKTKKWDLTQRNTLATVSVKYRNNGAESQCVSATIQHDNEIATPILTLKNPATSPSNIAIPTLRLSAKAFARGDVLSLHLRDDCSGEALAETPPLTEPLKNVDLVAKRAVPSNIPLQLSARNQDAFGNVSCSNAVSYLYDSEVATPVLTLSNPSRARSNQSALPTFIITGGKFAAGDLLRLYGSADCSGTVKASLGPLAAPTEQLTLSVLSPVAPNVMQTFSVGITDAASNSSCSLVAARYHYDTLPPSGLSISINGGATYSISSTVSLSLGATEASEMYLSNVSGCQAGGSWEAYQTTKSWTLGQTNATATVYAKFRDEAGNETACIQSTIIHDNLIASPSIALHAPSVSPGIVAIPSFRISGNFLLHDRLRLYASADCSGTAIADSGSLAAATASLDLSPSTAVPADVTKSYSVKNADPAGNQSCSLSAVSYFYDTLPPTDAAVVINSGATYTKAATQTLSLTVNGATEMYITNTAGCASGGSYEPLAASKIWTLSQSNATATVYVKFKDGVGNESACVNDSIIHDDTITAANLVLQNPATSPGNVARPTFRASAASFAVGDTLNLYASNNCTGSIIATSGALGSVASNVDLTVTADVGADANVTYSVKNSDAAGNEICGTTAIYHYDTLPPSGTSLSIASGATFTTTTNVTLSLGASGATQMYITNTAGCGSGGTWESYATTKAWTLAQSNAAATVYVKFRDLVQNESGCINDTIIHDDTIATPTLALQSPSTSPGLNGTPTFRASASSYAVNDTLELFISANCSGTSVATFNVASVSTTQDLAPPSNVTANASLSYTVKNTDPAGNSGCSNSVTYIYDTLVPSVTISTTSGAATKVSPIPITVTFSEAVTGFDSTKPVLTNATLSSFSGSGTTYTFNAIPSGQGAVTIAVGAAKAIDLAGNANTAASTLTVTYDTVSPTVSLSTTAASSTKVSPIPVTITFSEAVTGFSVSGVSVTNATKSGFSGSGSSYSLNLTPSGNGTVSATVNAAVATDAAGNNNTAAGSSVSVTYDTQAPTVTISTSQSSPTNSSSIPLTIVFNESVSGFSGAGIAATNGSISNFSGSGSSYTATLIPTGDGTVSATVSAAAASDQAGNSNTAAATPVSLTSDRTAPTVVSTSTSAATGNYINGATIPISITFSEAVTVNTTGGTPRLSLSDSLGNLSYASGSGSSTLVLQPLTVGSSHYSADLQPASTSAFSANGGTIRDAAGNDAVLTLPTPNGAGCFSQGKVLLVEGSVPTVSNLLLNTQATPSTVSSPSIRVDVNLADTHSNVTHICVKSQRSALGAMTAPLANDSCWKTMALVGASASASVAVTNLTYGLPTTGDTYAVFAWAKDQYNNVSLTQNLTGTDKNLITLTSPTAPTISLKAVTLADNTAAADFSSGTDFVIHWAASDANSLPASPMTVLWSKNDSTYTAIGSNLLNAANNSCTPVSGATGCYRYASDTNSLFSLKVTVTNAAALASSVQTETLNTQGKFKIFGKTDKGLGDSAQNFVIGHGVSGLRYPQHNQFVVTREGDIYLVDSVYGVVKVPWATRKPEIFIPKGTYPGDITGTSGQSAATVLANLKIPAPIAILIDWTTPTQRLIVREAWQMYVINLNDPVKVRRYVTVNAQPFLTRDGLYVGFTLYNLNDGSSKTLSKTGTFNNGSGDVAYSSCNHSANGFLTDPYSSNTYYEQYSFGYAACAGASLGLVNLSSATIDLIGPPSSSTPVTTLPAPLFNSYDAYMYAGLDGITYGFHRYGTGKVFRYRFDTATWVAVAGSWPTSGTQTSCADGVQALACSLDVQSIFVDENSTVYLLDMDRIRMIGADGAMQTLVGVSPRDRSDLPANQSLVTSGVMQIASDGELVFANTAASTLRAFNVTQTNPTMTTVAGNGVSGDPSNGTVATSASLTLMRPSGYGHTSSFGMDPQSKDIYWADRKLNRSTGKWEQYINSICTNAAIYKSYTYGDGLNRGSIQWRCGESTEGVEVNGSSQGIVAEYVKALPGVLASSGSIVAGTRTYTGLPWTAINVLGYLNNKVVINYILRDSYAAPISGNATRSLAAVRNPAIKLYDTSGVQSHLLGRVGDASNTITTTMDGFALPYVCPDGTAANNCQLGTSYAASPQDYLLQYFDDGVNPPAYYWLNASNLKRLIKLNPNGTSAVSTELTTAGNMASFVVVKRGTDNVLYYCRDTGALYRRVLGTSTETQITFSLPNITCSGATMLQRNSGGTDYIYMYVVRNGLTGILQGDRIKIALT